ncbi:MAG: DUF1287 domain-containing protein [Armatimonadetes bacterium]|nr:DUF1287 domain-containing protein [Armatimonadota bacterium]
MAACFALGVWLGVRERPVETETIARLDPPRPAGFGERLARAAEELTHTAVTYDAAYVKLPYPGGDVPADRGVCADLVIRAYRKLDIDLQVKVHEDMLAHRSAYPDTARPDASIDHRRVWNLAAWFKRHGTTLPCSYRPEDYHPGDIVVWRLPSGQGHIGIVASQRSADGRRPLVVQNVGYGQNLDDALLLWPHVGHYRYGG